MTMLSIDKVVSTIGDKISYLRKQKNLSLSQLAKKAGISPTSIHKLERSEMTPTVTLLLRIADALEVKGSFFLREKTDDFDYLESVEHVVKKTARIVRKAKGGPTLQYAAFRLRGAQLYSQIVHFPIGISSGAEPHTHAGEILIYCLEGEVLHEVAGKTYLLHKGDSIHHFCSHPHRWEVTGKKGAKILWIATPPPTGEFTEFWK
jgi:transcriptional regulator with XRE-family HTH domain